MAVANRDGVDLDSCEVGPNVTVGRGTTIRGSRLRDTIVGEASRIEDSDLHDSLIGDEVVIRAVRGQVDVGDQSVVNGSTTPNAPEADGH